MWSQAQWTAAVAPRSLYCWDRACTSVPVVLVLLYIAWLHRDLARSTLYGLGSPSSRFETKPDTLKRSKRGGVRIHVCFTVDSLNESLRHDFQKRCHSCPHPNNHEIPYGATSSDERGFSKNTSILRQFPLLSSRRRNV